MALEEKDQYSFKELWEEIAERAGMEPANLDELPLCSQYVWPSPEGQPMRFSLGEPSPFKNPARVFAIFLDEDLARVYTMPAGGADEKNRAPKRYTLQSWSRFGVEAMGLQTFLDEIATEIGDLDPAGEEREAIAQWLAENVSPAVADQIREGAHEDVEDEDEDDVETGKVIPLPAPGVAAPPKAEPEESPGGRAT
jgi:hypothetical protein